MVKKSIIVDSVDVSRCDYYTQGKCYKIDARECECDNSFDLITPCNGFPNCMYKELQRKKQECEELKGKVAKANNQAIHNLAMSERHRKALGKIEEYIKEFYYCESCENRETLDHILNLINAAIGGDDVK